MKEIKIDGIEYTLTPKAPEFEYPMWFQANIGKLIVEFVGLEEGTVVKERGISTHSIGYKSTDWTPHTNSEAWTQVPNPNELQDKDLVYCWDDENTHVINIRFYDGINKCSYCYDGKRGCTTWENYLKADIDDLPEPIRTKFTEARKTLED